MRWLEAVQELAQRYYYCCTAQILLFLLCSPRDFRLKVQALLASFVLLLLYVSLSRHNTPALTAVQRGEHAYPFRFDIFALFLIGGAEMEKVLEVLGTRFADRF